MHLVVADKGAVHANRHAGAAGHVEHVTHAQQGFGAHLVQDGAAVDLAADLKGDARRYVGLDQAGNHIDAGTLRRQNQVNARRARLLRQPGNQFLDLLAHHHHQVSQFVNHDHDVRQASQRFGRVGRQAERVVDKLAMRLGVVNLRVVAGQVAHPQFAQQFVTPLHLGNAPAQAIGGLFHVGHHRREQVRNAFVERHLQHLGVYHQEAHIAGLGLVQQTQNHGVDSDRLAGAGGTRHQHVRHLGQIRNDRVANNVLTQAHGQQGLGFVVNLRAQNFGELDRLPLGIGQLKRHVILARNGLHHADRHQTQRTCQILGQTDDLRAFHANRRLDFIARNHWPGLCQHDTHLHSEILQPFLDHAAGHLQRLGRDRLLAQQSPVEQIDLRQAAVRQLDKQGFLPLLRHPLTLGYLSQYGLDPQGRGVLFDLLLLLLDDNLLALAHGLLPERNVLLQFPLFAPRLDLKKEPGAQTLCYLGP